MILTIKSHKQHTKVVTQNCSPAPSQSEAVIIGLETQTNPFS
jgi:hypothetical protein